MTDDLKKAERKNRVIGVDSNDKEQKNGAFFA
jgi:hypothetical protein